MVPLLLYLFTGVATAVPVLWALGWAASGAGVTPTEYLSLLGSLSLVVAASIARSNQRSAARLAMAGTLAVWSFYLPAIVGMATISLHDQELGLEVLLWRPSASPLTIQNPAQFPTLSPSVVRQIEDTGITGSLSAYSSDGRYGSGKKSHVTLVMQGPVTQPIALPEPDASNVVWVQYGEGWKMFPAGAPTLKRTIWIEPEREDPKQSIVMVELASGARQGFGVWWPKINPEKAGR